MMIKMGNEKKLVEAITSMEVDFAQWYTDVVKKAELITYSSVKGCMIIKPAGYAIWELIQQQLDFMFKETGVENVYMPMFIPESLLNKEKDSKTNNQEDEFIGSFETMKDIYKNIGLAAKNDSNVLIIGDTGTGKDLIAKLIHKNSLNSNENIAKTSNTDVYSNP